MVLKYHIRYLPFLFKTKILRPSCKYAKKKLLYKQEMNLQCLFFTRNDYDFDFFSKISSNLPIFRF